MSSPLIYVKSYERMWPLVKNNLNASKISLYPKKAAFFYLKHRKSERDILFRLSAPLVVAGQSCKLCLLFLPATILGTCYLMTKSNLIEGLFYKSIRIGLQRAGPTFAKLGQWAATRPDILPLKLCRELGKLQSGAPSHEHAWNRKLVQDIFGCPLEDVFFSFDPKPIGSGTIGQVHKARLRENPNELVAVKVIHPGVHERIEREILLVRALANLLDHIPGIKWMSFREQGVLFERMMREQLDLRQEAWTLSRFVRNFRNQSVEFARPILATPSLLIQTWEGGVSLDEYLHSKERNNQDLQTIAKSGLSAFLQMLLWDNFVHADLHPGNIKVNISTSPPHLIILDTGLTIELGPMDHDNLADLFRAMFLEQNHRRVAELMLERKPQPLLLDREGFITQVAALCEQINPLKRGDLRLLGIPVGETLLKAFETARMHRVQLEPAFTRVVMALVVIEGVGRQLYPDLDLMPIMRQAALQYVISETARRITQKIQPIL